MAASGGLAGLARGLSGAGFRELYGTEERCRRALSELRWGRGWSCPACGHGRHAALTTRPVLQCNRCKRQVSLTAGTLFDNTKLPLTTWFVAIYHLSQGKGGISSVELGRRLGVRQGTAWLLKHKLMQAMAEREAGKVPFVAAVETTPERKPRRLRLTVVKGFRKKEVEKLARSGFATGSTVVTDGLSCWPAVTEAGCEHRPMRTGSGPQAARWSPFKWVNTALGDIETALAGTHHHVSPKHAQRYLSSFAWRFNRRFQLDTAVQRLAWACAHTGPRPYSLIVAG
jgi:hypothetical protein